MAIPSRIPMVAVIRARAMVGSPVPMTPLTIPPRRKAKISNNIVSVLEVGAMLT